MHSSQRHPYYYYDALEALRNRVLHSDDERRDAMTRVSLNAGDLRAAAVYADLDNLDWQHFYPAATPVEQVTTENAIDTFLEQYGHQSPEEDALLERMIFNPTPEYQIDADRLVADAPADEQDALIDSFVAKHPAPETAETAPKPVSDDQPVTCDKPADATIDDDITQPLIIEETSQTDVANDGMRGQKPPTPAQPAAKAAPQTTAELETPDDTSLSESLARIFIKQGQYERAFEIISSLNLKNPKKSVYFADQLRFLQKLIEIERGRQAGRTAHQNQ